MKGWIAAGVCLFGAMAVCGCGAGKNTVKAAEDGILKVAVFDSRDEYAGYDAARAVYIGKEPDMVNALALKLNLPVEFIPAAESELTGLLDSGQADLAVGCIPKSGSLESRYEVSLPYGTRRLYAVTSRGDFSDMPSDFADKKTGMSLKVGEIARLNLGEADGENRRDYNTPEQAETDLINGAIAGYFCYEKEALILCKKPELQVQSMVGTKPEQFIFLAPKGEKILMEYLDEVINDFLDDPK